MHPSFSRIYTGSLEGNAYRCLFIAPTWLQAREVFDAFKEEFREKAYFSDARLVATFKTGAVVIFYACRDMKEAGLCGRASYNALEIGPLFESRWEMEDGVEESLLKKVRV